MGFGDGERFKHSVCPVSHSIGQVGGSEHVANVGPVSMVVVFGSVDECLGSCQPVAQHSLATEGPAGDRKR
jgi:hypothetical protein